MPDKQRGLHIITEMLAIPVGVYLVYLGSTLDVSQFNSIALITIGIGNLVIDGYLLTRWFT